MKPYTVQKGDSLWKISKSNGVSLEAVIAANPQIKDSNAISVGQIVMIPTTSEVGGTTPATEMVAPATTSLAGPTASVTSAELPTTPVTEMVMPAPKVAATNPKWGQMWKYVVKNGDTMWKIAKQVGVTLDQLVAANPQVANPGQIQPGQVLNIPSGSMLMKEKANTGAQISPSAVPNQKELLTMPKPEAIAPITPEVPVMETKPKFELPAMEFPKLPSLPNVTVPSINVPINMPINANDVIEQKTYNIGPSGNKNYSVPVFNHAPVQSAPMTQVQTAPPAPMMQMAAPQPMYQMAPMYHHPHPHHPHCVCKTVIHAPQCGCHHKHHHKHMTPHHHHMHPEYYVHYTYVQPHAYVPQPQPQVQMQPQYTAPAVQSPNYYGAAQTGAPGEFGPYSYQPYQPTNQNATIN